ncbi:MAG: pyridoxal phosphate-dependent aminotransferase [Bacteroidetes bacterium]|nr:pyridoxal phosphate-dependent aminotransferase [Bacteroidota bacterium]
MNLSERINNITEPQTIGMARKARELKAQGVDVISLSLGEPDFNTPDPIKLAAKKAIDENFSHYTHVSGYLELRQAITKKFKRDNNLDYTPDQIVVSTGAKQSIANVMLCILNPGDEVLVPAPYWVTYLELVKLAGGIPVVIPTTVENNFKVTPQQIKKAITSKTKAIIFSSPCNPTGSVYTKEELKAFADVFAAHKEIYIISDEIYEHINFIGKHESIAQFPEMKERTIVVNGASKSFAMTGWRVGYIGAAKEIAQACDKIQGQFTSATCSIGQKAMHAAAEMEVSAIHPMRDAFKKRRDIVYKLLKEIPKVKVNYPDGAFYFFPDISYYIGKGGIKNSTDLCMYLLDKGHVGLVPGDAFGDDNHIRISYAASEDKLIEAMKRIKNALAELK